MPAGCGALVDALVHLVVANFDGAVALLGQGQEGQGRWGAQTEPPTAATGTLCGTASRRGTAAAIVAVFATATGENTRSPGGGVDAAGPARRKAPGRRYSRGGWRAPRGGGAGVAVVSLLKPAVRHDLVDKQSWSSRSSGTLP